jgi:hypothetical protein
MSEEAKIPERSDLEQNESSEKAKENICKKDTGRLAVPEPTEPTLDALKHGQEVIDNREARNMDYSEPTVATDAYVPSKDDIEADGNKEEVDLSGEYAIAEGKAQASRKAGKEGSSVVNFVNEQQGE